MKTGLGRFLNILLAASSLWLWASETRADLTITPRVITIQAVKGDLANRTLVLHPTEAITELKAIALDAYLSDDSAVLSADAMALGTVPDQMAANTLIKVPIQVDLSQAKSGEFTGEIRFTHAEGSESVPITIRVKDAWELPLLTLFIGVVIGMTVSTYSGQGRLRDEVRVSLENLQTQIASDRDTAKSFWNRANMHLVIAQQAQTSKQLTEAQTALTAARATWRQWLQHRPNWQIQFDYYDTLRDRINTQKTRLPTFLLLQAIGRELAETMQMAPDATHPNDFQQQLDTLAKKFNTALRLQEQLIRFQDLATTLEPEQTIDWEEKIDALQQRLYTLQLSEIVNSRP